MKDIKKPTRLSLQDMVAVLSIGAISLLVLAASFNIPIVPVLGVMIASGFAIIIYARLAETPNTLPSDTHYTQQNEDTYLASQARLADGISDAVTMIDKRERVIYANPAARELLKLKTLGRPLSTYVREPGVRTIVHDALEGKTPAPLTYHIEDPTERHIRLMVSPFTLDAYDPPRPMALAFFYDITEYKLADSQKADFLANASHELKTPIASLLGYIETLRGHAKDDPEAQERFLAIMQNQAERMQRLINDLISLRRIEQTEHLSPDETADLYLATKAAMEAVEPLAKKRKVKIKFTGKKNALVIGDQDELIQLVLNLLDNAIKISPSDTNVTLTLESEHAWQPGRAFTDKGFSEAAHSRRIVSPANTSLPFYILTLHDSGPGFSREHLPRIGERFYRIAGDLSSKEKGTGLGLAIVKHITRRHRGGLLIQSELDEGTAFTVLIPAAHTA